MLGPFENFVIPHMRTQIMGHTKTEALKALYPFYENSGICFTGLSSSEKPASWQNTMFRSLYFEP